MISIFEGLAVMFETFERLRLPYAVVGSFASGAWGQPRQTNDIDLPVALHEGHVASLVEALSPTFFLDEREIRATLNSTDPYRAFQMLHEATSFKVDAFVPILDDYNYGVLKRAAKVELAHGVSARCESAEDTVIAKLRWFELGNRVSDRQWNDIVQVLEVRAGLLDLDYLRRWSRQYSVDELFEAALAQALPA
jgi:hypothetical protein